MPSQSWIRGMSIEESQAIIPTDVQSHLTQVVQTHNAVSVTSGNNSVPSSWTSCDGFRQISVGVTTTGKTSLKIYWSYDGSTLHSQEMLINNAEPKTTDVAAPYFKLVPQNDDTVTETITVYAYLMA
jgi:hypothetical protein